ncbi:MAG TPA: cytochrome c, partial [Caulobacteraceae bacterium]|nr:cytochrome c [Caulobacteraceae bacterium]
MRVVRSDVAACLALAIGLLTSGVATADVNHGRDLVQKNCGGCHAVGKTGASPSPTAPAFRDLHQRYPVDSLAEALAEGILTGHPQMPEFN